MALVLVALACASGPPARREPPPPPSSDRTGDSEFLAALEAAAREFEAQSDALAAGVYEPFLHPDSVAVRGRSPGMPPETALAPTAVLDFGPDDPTTEELLGTLRPATPYNQMRDGPPIPPVGMPATENDVIWTLQAGAFGAESGALVRLRQLASDFPDWPRWRTAERGLFRVYVGRFLDRADAERAQVELAARGYGDAWIVRTP